MTLNTKNTSGGKCAMPKALIGLSSEKGSTLHTRGKSEPPLYQLLYIDCEGLAGRHS